MMEGGLHTNRGIVMLPLGAIFLALISSMTCATNVTRKISNVFYCENGVVYSGL